MSRCKIEYEVRERVFGDGENLIYFYLNDSRKRFD